MAAGELFNGQIGDFFTQDRLKMLPQCIQIQFFACPDSTSLIDEIIYCHVCLSKLTIGDHVCHVCLLQVSKVIELDQR